LAHLFSALRDKELAPSGKKEQQSERYPRNKTSELLPRVQLI
jgi:hypothetical protein